MYCKCHLIKLKVCCRIVVILHTRLDERHLIMNEIAISNLTTPPSYYPINISKQEKSRLDRYVAYLESTGRNWLSADLASYRDYLLDTGLSPASVRAILSTLRTALKRVAQDRD